MASIRRNDILQRRHRYRKFNCRPTKLDTENRIQQHQKFRIVRRIFLSSSFDRWRKLRSSLKLTDSSLAWHLMEAHERGECKTCRTTMEEEHESNQDFKMLERCLVSCISNFFELEDYIDMIGFICLDFGDGKKWKVKLQKVIKPNAQFKPESQPETSNYCVHTLQATRAFSPPSQLKDSQLPNFSSTPISKSIAEHAGDASQKVSNESFGIDKSSEDNLIDKQSPVIKPIECKSFNLSSCSVESGLSVEIDVVGTDSSQEIMPENDHQELAEEGSSPSSSMNITMDQYAAQKVQSHNKETKTEMSEATDVLSDYCQQGKQCYELSLLKVETVDTNQIEDVALHQKGTEPDSSSRLEPDRQAFMSKLETASPKSIDDATQMVVQPYAQEESADQNVSMIFQPTDCPLDMSLLKSNDDKDSLSERTSSKEREMFSINEEDGQGPSSDQSNYSAKRKAPSEDPDDRNTIVNSEFSPRQKKFHSCFEGTTGGVHKPEKERNKNYAKEVFKDPDNNNEKNHDGKSFLGMSLSSSLHSYTGMENVNLHVNVSHSASQDLSVENTRAYQLEEGRCTPEKKRDNNSQSSSPSLVSRHPTRVITPCPNAYATSSGAAFLRHPTVSSSPGGSIPWQRRDMSRKEEYEFLELNPFCDLAEFSARHPHVHQRTYYRWKRRIKEEFMVLEQCPDMTFTQFSGVVLQAKENVYSLWKSLIAQGKGFFAPSDSSKRLESKLSSSQVIASPQEHQQHLSAESDFLQKNLSASFLDFSQQFPRASLNIFNSLKQKSLQEFALFHQNKHMSFKDFSKLVNISEEVFKEWQAGVQSVSDLHGPTSNHFPGSLHTLHQTVPGKTTDSNGLHKNAMKSHMSNDQSIVPSLSDMPTLSASYLASLQNLMFPWPGYYGLNPPLAPQHLLPFMLWPGMHNMMGGFPGAPNPAGSLALLSQLQAASSTSSPTSLSSGQLLSPKATDLKTASPQATACVNDKLAPVKVEKDKEIQKLHKTAKLTHPARAVSSPQSFQQSERDEPGDSGSLTLLNRSRKQNLQEYIHYLHKPELSFTDLVTLFPSISSRTFYRWRKEINAAVLLLEETPDVEFLHFKTVFPDIPEDIFELWQSRVKSGKAILNPGTLNGFRESVSRQDFYLNSPFKNNHNHEVETKCIASIQNIARNASPIMSLPLEESSFIPDTKSSSVSISALSGNNLGDDLAVQKKCYKEDYLFVQRNPGLDFSSFTRQFPNTSVRTFYRWKKELKDAVEFLRCNPSVDYTAYKTMDATVSEKVFNIWKEIVQKNVMFEEDANQEIATKEADRLAYSTDENYNTALSYLHTNPSINYSQFQQVFPEVEEKTFEMWRKETTQLIRYIQDKPHIQYSDLSALLPHISHSSFLKWKEMPANLISKHCKDMYKNDTNQIQPDYGEECTKSKMTKAFVYLMYHPTLSFEEYKAIFDFISPPTYDLWLTKIREVIVDILSHPNMSYKDSNIRDMSPDLFEKLRNLQPQELALIDKRCREAKAQYETTRANSPSVESTSTQLLVQRAFEYLQTNSSTSWEDFRALYPVVPREVFQTWVASMCDKKNYLKEKPDVTYQQFSKCFPTTSEEVFHQLQRDSCSPSLKNHAYHFLGRHESFKGKDIHQTQEMACESLVNGKLCPKQQTEAEYSCSSRESESFLDMESSLSKLAKFAHSSELLSPHYKRETAKPTEQAMSDKLSQYHTDLGYSCQVTDTEDVTRFPLTHHSSFKSQFLTATHYPENKMDDGLEEVKSSLPSSSSAPEHLSANDNTYQRNQISQNLSKTPGKDYVSPGSHWQNQSQHLETDEAVNSREDDEAFSSQRQKKMSRAEYMFVKANPEVDSQEFSRIFPGVSARTFYRWKKEIRAQMQQT